MTKRDLVVRISNETGLIQQDVMAVLQKSLDYITESLAQGETVEFRNFGVFEVRTRKQRIGRNPGRPAEVVTIPERKVVKFKPGKIMTQAGDRRVAGAGASDMASSSLQALAGYVRHPRAGGRALAAHRGRGPPGDGAVRLHRDPHARARAHRAVHALARRRAPTSCRRRCTRSRTAADATSRCGPRGRPGVIRARGRRRARRRRTRALYYLGPMFRCERPQAGRKRQFHQLGHRGPGRTQPGDGRGVHGPAVPPLSAWGLEGYRARAQYPRHAGRPQGRAADGLRDAAPAPRREARARTAGAAWRRTSCACSTARTRPAARPWKRLPPVTDFMSDDVARLPRRGAWRCCGRWTSRHT